MKGVAAALLLVTTAPALAATPVEMRVEDSAYGRVLVTELTVDAPAARVWEQIATAEGWTRWAVPVAWIDFRVGGLAETSYDPKARRGDDSTIHNRILSFIPGRMLSLQAEKGPRDFPFAEELPHVASVFELEPAGDGRTRIRLTGVGYRDTKDAARMLDFFAAGNRWTLEKLAESLERGPVDWARTLPPAK